MITKGIIESKSSANKYLVRIPILSNSSVGNSNIEISKIEATVCYEPGNYNEYKNGDVVFIAFEDNTYSQPVIMGKLYTGVDSKENNLIQASNLTVFDSAKLPKSTIIGDYTYKDFEGMFNYLQVLSNASQSSTSSNYKVFNDVVVKSSDFATDSTYSDFKYKATVNLENIKSSDVINVIFSMIEATSGNYSPVCESFNGGVYFWSKINTQIIIPTIEVHSV